MDHQWVDDVDVFPIEISKANQVFCVTGSVHIRIIPEKKRENDPSNVGGFHPVRIAGIHGEILDFLYTNVLENDPISTATFRQVGPPNLVLPESKIIWLIL